MCVVCFFFQAEDGIRDLVRSRGLGDVYKRQGRISAVLATTRFDAAQSLEDTLIRYVRRYNHHIPVSYTHLTLPTSDLV